MTAPSGPFARTRIPAQALALSDSVDTRLAAVIAREKELDEREKELVARAYEAGLNKAYEQVRGEISAQAAWFTVNVAQLSREILRGVLAATHTAMHTVLSDESSVEITVSRVRKLVIDIADRNVKLYCSNQDFDRIEGILNSVREADDIAITLSVDEALRANDLVIESDLGVIHATVSSFVDATIRIIHAQLDETIKSNGMPKLGEPAESNGGAYSPSTEATAVSANERKLPDQLDPAYAKVELIEND
jgi:flagellar biosynthesis/type III secretory pathway protein FliH